MEPLFGTAAPQWAGATPGPAWQAPIAARPAGSVTAAFGVQPYFPAPLLAPDAFAAFSVPALLAAVAIRRGQLLGPTSDQEIEDFVYDALELLPGMTEVDVRCEGSRVMFTGSVQHKRLKREVGEIGWAIPSVVDVQNNVTINARRRTRPERREADAQPPGVKPKERQ